MISGSVSAALEVTVRLRLRGPGGIESALDALIDTGFDDFLSIPISIATSLGLTLRSSSQATLADGSVKRFDYFLRK